MTSSLSLVVRLTVLAVERLSKARGVPPNLPNLPESAIFNLISDVVDEMRTRRPYNPFNIENSSLRLNNLVSNHSWSDDIPV